MSCEWMEMIGVESLIKVYNWRPSNNSARCDAYDGLWLYIVAQFGYSAELLSRDIVINFLRTEATVKKSPWKMYTVSGQLYSVSTKWMKWWWWWIWVNQIKYTIPYKHGPSIAADSIHWIDEIMYFSPSLSHTHFELNYSEAIWLWLPIRRKRKNVIHRNDTMTEWYDDTQVHRSTKHIQKPQFYFEHQAYLRHPLHTARDNEIYFWPSIEKLHPSYVPRNAKCECLTAYSLSVCCVWRTNKQFQLCIFAVDDMYCVSTYEM